MRCYLLIITFFICLRQSAQELISSSTSIESCLDSRDCLTTNNSTYLFYDETKSEFYLKVDFSKFKTENDTTNNWINDMVDSMLYFRAILPKENFPALSNQNTITLKLNGQVFYNNTWKAQPVELSIYPTENSIVPSPAAGTNYKYDNYKVNFNIPFVPSDFKAYKKIYYEDQTVSIEVTLGRINLLKPGMEPDLKEVYYNSPY